MISTQTQPNANFPILIDGEPTTLYNYIFDNTAPDVDQPAEEDFNAVTSLKPGEHTFVGFFKVERP